MLESSSVRSEVSPEDALCETVREAAALAFSISQLASLLPGNDQSTVNLQALALLSAATAERAARMAEELAEVAEERRRTA